MNPVLRFTVRVTVVHTTYDDGPCRHRVSFAVPPIEGESPFGDRVSVDLVESQVGTMRTRVGKDVLFCVEDT